LIARLLGGLPELKTCVLDCEPRLLLLHSGNIGHNRGALSETHGERHVDPALLCVSCRRILLKNGSLRDCAMVTRFALHAVKAGLVERGNGVVKWHSNDSWNLSVIGKNFGWKRKEKKKYVSKEETEDRDEKIGECAPSECAAVHLISSPQSRGECAVAPMQLWKHAQISAIDGFGRYDSRRRSFETPFRILREE
jgi:hypothetical protein